MGLTPSIRKASRPGMGKSSFAEPSYPEPRTAMGIRARNFRIGAHPVMIIGHPLLGRQERQNGGQRIHRKMIDVREDQALALHQEIGSSHMVANHRLVTGNHLDLEIEKFERPVGQSSSPAFMIYSLDYLITISCSPTRMQCAECLRLHCASIVHQIHRTAPSVMTNGPPAQHVHSRYAEMALQNDGTRVYIAFYQSNIQFEG